MNKFDVIVVGAGHAGCEAALAAARIGVKTALITLSRNTIAAMSCNPAIGGIAKSHLVSEIDALGGEMARNADYTGIQFRVLNTRKGPAVRSIRIQCDKEAYAQRMMSIIDNTENICVICAKVISISLINGKINGVMLDDFTVIRSEAVILTTGTFLRGVIHVGKKSMPGGRIGEKSSVELSASLIDCGITIRRFKTGTPPRLHKDSIDYCKMSVQSGDRHPLFISHAARAEYRLFNVEHKHYSDEIVKQLFHVKHFNNMMRPWQINSDQIPCYITYTNSDTHRIIRDNIKNSALYGGSIVATGVRYCPSIEDKIVKFAHHDKHHVFIEPEGRSSIFVYPNGVSNSFPEHIQIEMIRSIRGLENADIIKYAYAIEYDYIDPTTLSNTLESKIIENLFIAGQINGTTGYEEAAALGFVAGVNAARKTMGESPVVFSRCDAYIGVLIDDLVTKGVDEPYRMFTSRAEHRLVLRQDNARHRLIEYAEKIGIVDRVVIDGLKKEIAAIKCEVARLKQTYIKDNISLAQLLRQPGMNYNSLPHKITIINEDIINQVEHDIKYGGYIEREMDRIKKMKAMDDHLIPVEINYNTIKSLRLEARHKLTAIKPVNIGQASRIPGVNPSDISLLAIVIKKLNNNFLSY